MALGAIEDERRQRAVLAADAQLAAGKSRIVAGQPRGCAGRRRAGGGRRRVRDRLLTGTDSEALETAAAVAVVDVTFSEVHQHYYV